MLLVTIPYYTHYYVVRHYDVIQRQIRPLIHDDGISIVFLGIRNKSITDQGTYDNTRHWLSFGPTAITFGPTLCMHGYCVDYVCSVVQRQTAVTAYFTSEQLPLFVFAGQ